MTLMGRIVAVVSFAALVAMVTIFAKPLWQGALQMKVRRHLKPLNHLTDLQRITRRRITHSFQPQRLQRPLLRRQQRLLLGNLPQANSKRRSHRTRKNRGAPFGG